MGFGFGIGNLIGGAAGAHISMTLYACASAVASRLSPTQHLPCMFKRIPNCYCASACLHAERNVNQCQCQSEIVNVADMLLRSPRKRIVMANLSVGLSVRHTVGIVSK